ncbi:putative acyl--CoA ligase YdaB [Tribolium madens]|uniref:putative acyl--CoA ligase YdaB n=1 Tax=Tribolium madens TaxID=41895 RepID=UPI001CF73659|nr:putative acyl--CoA ligase YdaB [Tribolium madens]
MEPPEKGASKPCLEGPIVKISENYGGLGAHFLDRLFENLNKINQIDTVTGITESNGSVRSRAIQIAHEIRHLGVVENDIVVICCRSHADQTIVVLACLLIGAIVAPIDAELHHKECVGIVTQLKPKMCFCDLRTLKQIERILAETGIKSKLVHFGDQQQYALAFRKLLSNRQYPEDFKPIIVEQPRKKVAFILATQGTTDTPRLVCLSHHFIYCQILVFLQTLGSPEKIISYYPLSWVMQVVLMCLCFEVPVVRVLTGAFVERTACKLIHDLKIDTAFLNTELALQLVEHVAVKDFNLSCLKCVFIGSLATTSHDIKILVTRLPKVRFSQMYCTTETGVAIACPPRDYSESLERCGTVGKVVENCKLRVVDIDTRVDVDAECSGELLVTSDCLMLGYFKNLSATQAVMEGGYFKTGDIARYDASGWLYIEGRICEFIYVQGCKVSPRKLEELIMTHPFVKDTAVVSNDKEVVACVITKADTKLDENRLITFISERLPVQNWPTRIVFMTDFPTTPLGKIRRDVLKEEVLTVKIEHSESQWHVLG